MLAGRDEKARHLRWRDSLSISQSGIGLDDGHFASGSGPGGKCDLLAGGWRLQGNNHDLL